MTFTKNFIFLIVSYTDFPDSFRSIFTKTWIFKSIFTRLADIEIGFLRYSYNEFYKDLRTKNRLNTFKLSWPKSWNFQGILVKDSFFILRHSIFLIFIVLYSAYDLVKLSYGCLFVSFMPTSKPFIFQHSGRIPI